MADWAIALVAVGYVGFLFAVASWGDRRAAAGRQTVARQPLVYALSLAVYCTSWTFYGSVGLAADQGWTFLAVYVGPVLMLALGWPLIRRMVVVAKAQNIVSVADFVAARYGKSVWIAAAVTGIAVIGTIPYISLQLRAVSTSLTILTDNGPAGGPLPLLDAGLLVAILLAVFAILFGTRKIEVTGHNDGLILAIAFESVVKLFAFLLVGLVVTSAVFVGPAGFLSRIQAEADLRQLFAGGIDGPRWITITILSAAAILCLPRQFHVTVVENRNPDDVMRAAWLFPLYLVLINLFVAPIAAAGLISFGRGSIHPDTFVLVLPLLHGPDWLATVAFIGGLSAATAMVIVASVALSTMVANDLVLPLVLRRRRAADGLSPRLGRQLLAVRRLAIVIVLLLAYLVHRGIGEGFGLASIGLLSFAALAQVAPALVGGLYWHRATGAGALAGLGSGFALWGVTLLVPTLARSHLLDVALLEQGLFGLAMLRPEALLGLAGPDPLTHGVAWSLGANLATFVAVSAFTRPSALERVQADAFINVTPGPVLIGRRPWQRPPRLGALASAAAPFLGIERVQAALAQALAERGQAFDPDEPADAELVRRVERLLASAVGAASARLIVGRAVARTALDRRAALQLLDDTTAALQHNRDLLQATLDHLRQGVAVYDRDYRLVSANGAVREVLDLPTELVLPGVTLEQILAYNVERGEYGPGAPADLVAQRLSRIRASLETADERRRPDGRVVETRSAPMPDGGVVITFTDVTERAQSALLLARANEALEARVAQRTAELAEAKAAAERANRDKTRFLAAAGHDLMQPLTAARLHLAVLQQEARRRGLPASAVEPVDAALDSAEEILSALLEIARLDAGGLEAEIQPIALGPLLESLTLEFAPLAQRRGLRLRLVPTRLTVHSDRRLLRRVLQNLLSNALRYARRGGVLLGARRHGEGRVTVAVVDTGPGIPEDRLELAFEEFRRLGDGGADMPHGLGLGLSIVRRIARMLEHPLQVRSVVGRGSSFGIVLPRGPDAARADAPVLGMATAVVPLARLAVLVVENDVGVRSALTGLLGGWGLVVTAVGGVEEALALGPKPSFDLAIADLQLDDGDGLDLLERLGEGGRVATRLLVTADRAEATRARAAAAGIDLMPKPIKPAALRALLSRLVPALRAA